MDLPKSELVWIPVKDGFQLVYKVTIAAEMPTGGFVQYINAQDGRLAGSYSTSLPRNGKFEDRTFAGGTEAMIGTLKRLQAAGVAVYVGGGEGRAALERYGRLADVSHAFTAGGTILKCLADQPLPFIEALAAQSGA